MDTQMELDWAFASASASKQDRQERIRKPSKPWTRHSLILLFAIWKCLKFIVFGWARPLVGPLNRLEARFSDTFRRGSLVMNLTVALLVLLIPLGYAFNTLDRIRIGSGYTWSTYGDIVLSSILVPNAAQPMSKFQRELAYLYVGLTPTERDFFDEIAKCESSYRPNAVGINTDASGKIRSYDEGLLQINSWWGNKKLDVYENGRYRGEAFAAITNLQIATHILRTEGPDEWTCAHKLGLADIALN